MVGSVLSSLRSLVPVNLLENRHVSVNVLVVDHLELLPAVRAKSIR